MSKLYKNNICVYASVHINICNQMMYKDQVLKKILGDEGAK